MKISPPPSPSPSEGGGLGGGGKGFAERRTFNDEGYFRTKTTIPKAGGVVFYGVIGWRATSFKDLLTGEAAARPQIDGGRECGGGKASPVDKSLEKTGPEATDGRKDIPTGSIIQ